MPGRKVFEARIITLQGSHYQMGLQHGTQVQPLVKKIEIAIIARLAQINAKKPGPAFQALVEQTRALLLEHDPQTLQFISGLAEGLGIDKETLLYYNLAAFLFDALKTGVLEPDDGCTTFAAAGKATLDGTPLLAKNRDYELEHLPLQLVVHAYPHSGHAYTYITSAGSPGVMVAGMNAAGLALVDTHVPSNDIGPGLPTYALSMHVLESCDTVRKALAYLQTMPRLGRNNIILVDASGDMVLVELGNRHFGMIEAHNNFLVNTNHFCSVSMKSHFVDTSPLILQGSTQQRYELVRNLLEIAHGKIDLHFVEKILGTHGEFLSALCRHPRPDIEQSTIGSMIFLPAARMLYFNHGYPCQGQFQAIPVAPGFG